MHYNDFDGSHMFFCQDFQHKVCLQLLLHVPWMPAAVFSVAKVGRNLQSCTVELGAAAA